MLEKSTFQIFRQKFASFADLPIWLATEAKIA